MPSPVLRPTSRFTYRDLRGLLQVSIEFASYINEFCWQRDLRGGTQVSIEFPFEFKGLLAYRDLRDAVL